MKVIRWIQNVLAVAAMGTAVYLADGIDISRKDAVCASMMVALAMAMLIGRALEEEKRAE